MWLSPPFAQASADEANKGNKPPGLAASFNIRNCYTPSVFDAQQIRPHAAVAARSFSYLMSFSTREFTK
ncbi:hypothetical protein GCM10011400_24350 [Paraburkholderia caffeinilytica]|uniref:Uncharacterized protein n=1 Tax=Paraburkholderia caffeinilytica TaxID=1761016 RepID=A0ABQ1MCD0_9BURK|nr:hypothetical protein GCM10011400_24350 [Paraburkholderia caffeinilytica]